LPQPPCTLYKPNELSRSIKHAKAQMNLIVNTPKKSLDDAYPKIKLTCGDVDEATGKIGQIDYGNGTSTRYTYDPLSTKE